MNTNTILIVGVTALVAGIAIGYVISQSQKPEPESYTKSLVRSVVTTATAVGTATLMGRALSNA